VQGPTAPRPGEVGLTLHWTSGILEPDGLLNSSEPRPNQVRFSFAELK